MNKNLLMVLILILFTIPAYAQRASSQSIKELLDKTQAGDMGIQVMNQMLPSLKVMVPDAPDNFWREFMAGVNSDDLVEMIIPIYQKYLTEKDISELNKFYSSPVGKKLIRYQPIIMQESMTVGQRWGENIAKEVLKKYKQGNY
jgi:hypothetical protein|tara:strand:+ start:74 stop:505 length:432 start_codon:yes stop_codon:yes gene_type:complete